MWNPSISINGEGPRSLKIDKFIRLFWIYTWSMMHRYYKCFAYITWKIHEQSELQSICLYSPSQELGTTTVSKTQQDMRPSCLVTIFIWNPEAQTQHRRAGRKKSSSTTSELSKWIISGSVWEKLRTLGRERADFISQHFSILKRILFRLKIGLIN